jgi:hypothetical protein
MQSKKVSYLRGRRLRATRLDANGRPVYGDNAAVVTKGFITFGMTTNTEEGEAIVVTDANGDTCIAEAAVPTFNGIAAEAEFCNVDFALFTLLTGQPVVLDEDGRAIGITEETTVNLGDVNVALELWLGASADNAGVSEGSQGQFGYVLLPFVGGGVIGDITVENSNITFTITGMQTKNGANWGSGPYDVELVGGEPSPLRVPLSSNAHRRIMHTEVAPPAAYAGSIPLLDRTAPALTDVTATVTGRTAALAPTPAGTDPVFYDFGDGSWDYAETGSYSHTYAAAGTYSVTARRGDSEVTKNVVVAS